MHLFFTKNKVVLLAIVSMALFVGVASVFIWQNQIDEGESSTQQATVFYFEKEEIESPASIFGEDFKKFTHPEHGFSFEYPKELEIQAFKEEEDGEIIGETIVFQQLNFPEVSSQENSEEVGFQIFISPFEDEGGVLTQERVLEDLPFAVIIEPQEVFLGVLAEKEIPALIFWSEDPLIGKTREVWFIHDGYLYEITTYAHLDLWLANTLSTLTFPEMKLQEKS